MEVLCTSIIPIKFNDAEFTRKIETYCKHNSIVSDYTYYGGLINLKAIPDINTNFLRLYHIPSHKTDIQCAFCETTLTIILTWKNNYKDYFELVNNSLSKRKKLVQRVLNYNPKDEQLKPLLNVIKKYENDGVGINYAFTFYSIYDNNFTQSCEQHIKVLAEPSLINMDDMLSSIDINTTYSYKSKVDKEMLKTIKNIDLCGDQKTYVTWASIVTLSKDNQMFIRNHITLTLIEILIQRIWNLCYTQNKKLNDCITNIKTYSTDINQTIIDTYQILIESKNCISATYSSRISGLYKAIIESSQLSNNVNDLEQKLNYLIVFSNSITQNKNKSIQESSEILLFLIAIAQVIPIFFNLPIITHYMISISTVFSLCILGVILIRFKYRHKK